MELDNITKEELVKKYNILKEKINLQVDELKHLANEVNIRDKRIIELSERLNVMKEKTQDNDCDNHTEFTMVFDLFYRVMSDLLVNDVFYKTVKSTKNTRQFRIAGSADIKGILSKYITEYTTQKNENEIIKQWATVGLIDADDRGRCYFTFTYKGKSVRTIRVKKAAVKLVMSSMIHD